jgi:hypothetical protein
MGQEENLDREGRDMAEHLPEHSFGKRSVTNLNHWVGL